MQTTIAPPDAAARTASPHLDASQDTTSEEAASGPMSPRQLWWLKALVIGMGVMIVAAMLAIAGRIIYLAAKPAQTARAVAAAEIPAKDMRLPLPAGAVVQHIAIDGDRLAVHYQTATGGAIVVVDIMRGTTLSRVEFAPQAPR